MHTEKFDIIQLVKKMSVKNYNNNTKKEESSKVNPLQFSKHSSTNTHTRVHMVIQI